jgi:hypothetical protein
MRRCGDAAMRRCGDAAMRRCGDAAMRQARDDRQLAEAMERAIGQEVLRLEVLLLIGTGKALCRVHRSSGELEFTAAYAGGAIPTLLS